MLDGFFVIDSWRADSSHLEIRLVSDHFDAGVREPVLTIAVTALTDPAECEAALLRRKGELIVGLEVYEKHAAIYSEHDDEPALFRGSAVAVTRSPYSSEDFLGIIRQKDEELSVCYEQFGAWRSTIDGAAAFVSELIRRAEIKRGLTSRDSAPLDLEVDVLHRVLQRIRER